MEVLLSETKDKVQSRFMKLQDSLEHVGGRKDQAEEESWRTVRTVNLNR